MSFVPLLAPLSIGSMLALILQGVNLGRAFVYFNSFKDDAVRHRGIVGLLLILNLIHSGTLIATQMLYNVFNWGNVDYISHIPWSFSIEPALCGIVGCIVQCFYAWRIYILTSRCKTMPCIIVIGSVWQMGWAMGGTFICFHVNDWDQLASSFTYGVSSWLGGAAVVDITVAATLVVVLRRTKGGMTPTDNVLLDCSRGGVEWPHCAVLVAARAAVCDRPQQHGAHGAVLLPREAVRAVCARDAELAREEHGAASPSSSVRRDSELSPKASFHPVPVPALPPTPPGSTDHSPSRSTFTRADTDYYAGKPSATTTTAAHPTLLDAAATGPNRRHHFESPVTPVNAMFPHHSHYSPPTTKATVSHSTTANNAYGRGAGAASAAWGEPSPFRIASREFSSGFEEQSGWEGTFSSLFIKGLSSAKAAMALDSSPTLDTSPYSTSTIPVTMWKSSVHTMQGVSVASVRFGLLCALWYTMSALSSNTGKVILNRFRYPVTLTFVQFGFVAGWCLLFIAGRRGIMGRLFNGPRYGASTGGLCGLKRPNRAAMEGTLIMSFFQIAGHVFSSMAIARVPVSTVHTIKALSPLFTVLAYTGLFGVRYGRQTYMSLAPLTIGVMLACSFDLRANGVGFLCALGSTIIFVSQNIFGKKLLPKENENGKPGAMSTGSVKMDKLTLLFYSSGMAFVLMIPIWFYSDASSLVTRWFSDESSSSTGQYTTLGLSFYFFCNGSVHFAQCILAFSILSRTSPVTYSIASLIKRIAVICLAIVWFGQSVSMIQAFGMGMTFTGLWMYNRAKRDVDKGEKRRGEMERKGDLMLPVNNSDARLLDGCYSDISRSVSPMPLTMYGSATSTTASLTNHGGSGGGLLGSAFNNHSNSTLASSVNTSSATHDSVSHSSPTLGSALRSPPRTFGNGQDVATTTVMSNLTNNATITSGAHTRHAGGVGIGGGGHAKHRTPSLSFGPNSNLNFGSR